MAIFDQKAELNKQKRHIAPRWDNDGVNKMLGFNEKGGRNAWGQVLGMIPGVNTATHAIAKNRAGGSTKDVLNETFDEAVNKDFAGLSFGINIAKTAVGGGLGGGLKGMMGGGAGNVAGAVGGAKDALGATSGGAGQDVADLVGGVTGSGKDSNGGNGGGGFLDKLKSQFGGDDSQGTAEGPEAGNLEQAMSAFQSQTSKIQGENMKNPFVPGTPEYDQFIKEVEDKQKQDNKGAFGDGIKNTFKSATSGNIFESGANWAGSIVASQKEAKNEIKEASQGEFAYNPTLNYL